MYWTFLIIRSPWESEVLSKSWIDEDHLHELIMRYIIKYVAVIITVTAILFQTLATIDEGFYMKIASKTVASDSTESSFPTGGDNDNKDAELNWMPDRWLHRLPHFQSHTEEKNMNPEAPWARRSRSPPKYRFFIGFAFLDFAPMEGAPKPAHCFFLFP